MVAMGHDTVKCPSEKEDENKADSCPVAGRFRWSVEEAAIFEL